MWILVAIVVLASGQVDVQVFPVSSQSDCQEKVKQVSPILQNNPEVKNALLACKELKLV